MARPPIGKRKSDAIDLTASDDDLSTSQIHKIARRDPPGDFTQSQRDSWTNERTEEERANDILIILEDNDHTAVQDYELYGTLQTKVVGIRTSHGYIVLVCDLL